MPAQIALNESYTDTPAVVSTGYTVLEILFNPTTDTATVLLQSTTPGVPPMRIAYPYDGTVYMNLLNDVLATVVTMTGATGATMSSS
jgi:hypothetical protein